ncbi:hypothetical protein [Propionispira raffinosivorans]|uniref:hypothetical protein n=1 Tax=Propionispira raffinosivorans TaxID=86959 RepID=UPI001B7FA592|nr:hypothetical protein [Propionispira raffinosivorans]
MNDFRGLKGQFDKVNFIGLHDFKMGMAMNVPIGVRMRDFPAGYSGILSVLKSLIGEIFSQDYYYSYEHDNASKILFLFSHSYIIREDHRVMFFKTANLLPVRDVLEAHHCGRRIDFSWSSFLLLFYVMIWFWQIRYIKLSLKDRLYYIGNLVWGKRWARELYKIDFNGQYNLLVTLCDAHMADNMATQLFKKYRIMTATLQHGWYSMTIPKADSFRDINLGLEGMVSDKFLCYGEYSKQGAVVSGIELNRIVCLGNPQFIDMNKRYQTCPKKIFCLLLSRSLEAGTGYDFIANNREMIEIANEICLKMKMKYIIKYHPGEDKAETDLLYGKSIKQEFLHDQYWNTYPLIKLVDKVDFSITDGISTTYLEMLYMRQPSFRYIKHFDTFTKFAWGGFMDSSEVLVLIKMLDSQPEKIHKHIESMVEFVYGGGDVGAHYKKYLKTFM